MKNMRVILNEWSVILSGVRSTKWKNLAVFMIVCAFTALFAACSGNGSTDAIGVNSCASAEDETGSSSSNRGGYGDEDSAGSGDVDADSVYDGMKVKNENYLPECTKSREGISVYVRANDETLECKSSEWVTVESGNENPETPEDPKNDVGSSGSNIVKSSSSRAGSSSSVIPSGVEGSSSNTTDVVTFVDPSAVIKGTMTDSRDGQVYKTVTIGKQTWMAENLNFAYLQPTAEEDSSSFCYKNEPDSCAKYGRLYLWSAAMDSAAVFGATGKGCGYRNFCNIVSIDSKIWIRGVCPQGWHLPSDAEWVELFTAVGGKDSAGVKLKSTSGWYDDGNGLDSYGFGVLPAGSRFDNGSFGSAGRDAVFWSSIDSYYPVYLWVFDYSHEDVLRSNNSKVYGNSVRCLRDLD